MGKKNQRARYLLNVPDLIHHERLQQNGKVVRCHLITEDVSETKRKNNPFPFPEIFSNWGKNSVKLISFLLQVVRQSKAVESPVVSVLANLKSFWVPWPNSMPLASLGHLVPEMIPS